MPMMQPRRRFLARLFLARTAGLVPALRARALEPPPAICVALHELGMIKSTPQKRIIADGSDWRFLNKFKRELKA